jgi:dihydrolipoamide dehydrogenase
MRVDELANIPLAYPTHAAVLIRAAVSTAQQLDLGVGWRA